MASNHPSSQTPGRPKSGSHSPKHRDHPYPRRANSGPSVTLSPSMSSDDPSHPSLPRPRSTSEVVPSHGNTDPPTNQPGPGRGGCWTCRIRRKKCDERPVQGSCQTCNRLMIECLGFGPKPSWMRDKEQVDMYKAQIKTQLANRNMIRGLKKNPDAQALPQVSHRQSLQTPGSGSNFSRRDESSFDNYGGDSSASSFSNSPMIPPISVPSSTPPLPDVVQPHPNRVSISKPAMVHASPQQMLLQLPQSYTLVPDYNNEHLSMSGPSLTESPMPMTAMLPSIQQNASREALVVYYFHSVFQIQYVFALEPSVSSAIHSCLVQNPNGPVTSAVCALASLHSALMSGQEDFTVPKTYHDEALWQLRHSKEFNGQYSEADAMAALHLVSYSLFCGCTGDWLQPLNIAREWLERSPISSQPNPKMLLLSASDSVKYICKTTMWMDIFSSISLGISPRFMPLYQRLFRGGSGFWAQGSSSELDDLRMDVFMGCPDDVMLALAQTADLAHWKAQKKSNRCLSVRELVDRAAGIEQELRGVSSLNQRRHSSSSVFTPSPSISLPSLSPATTDSSGMTPTFAHPRAGSDPSEFGQLVGEVFRSAALVYLHTVTNDHHPRVPEIRDALRSVFHALDQLPFTEADRSLVLPILLAGSVTEDPTGIHNLRTRLGVQSQQFGNVSRISQLLETVWERRQLSTEEVDWRVVMREIGLQLLLA